MEFTEEQILLRALLRGLWENNSENFNMTNYDFPVNGLISIRKYSILFFQQLF